jgi:uncharacterized protein (TIGR02284 family)
MGTTTGGEDTLADLLNELIELDYDAIEAYRAAVARVEDLRDRARLAGFLDDHLRHVRDLSALVRDLGAEPAGCGDLRQILAKGKVVIGGLLGDRLVLEAMKANEADTTAAYERAAARELPPPARALVDRHLAEERRHHDWIVDRLDAAEGLLRL